MMKSNKHFEREVVQTGSGDDQCQIAGIAHWFYRMTVWMIRKRHLRWTFYGSLCTALALLSSVLFFFVGFGICCFAEILICRRIKSGDFVNGRHEGRVLWFTGLPASGKSTLAELVYRKLLKSGIPAEHLDGDEVREIFPQTGFDRDARNEHIRRIGYLASKLERHGVFVIASFISPYRESRDFVRGLCRNFMEVYLNPPIDVCIRRDPKGLYRKALDGKITNFTGVQDPYEEPLNPELTLDTSCLSVEEGVNRIWQCFFSDDRNLCTCQKMQSHEGKVP
jgi:adenylylsulfate kinase